MITIITAMDVNGLIGNGPFLPWAIPEEMKLFKKLTTGHTVLMGSTTHKSIGKVLPDRRNVILTRDPSKFNNIETCTDIDDFVSKNTDFFVIGGLQVYEEFINRKLVDRFIVSHIVYEYTGDIFFPKSALKGLHQTIIYECDHFTTKEYKC